MSLFIACYFDKLLRKELDSAKNKMNIEAIEVREGKK